MCWTGWITAILNSSKATILVNGSQFGYARHCYGLTQGDPFSSLHFILITDVPGMTFSHALDSGILYGVPLGDHGKMCNLLYTNDLLELIARSRGPHGHQIDSVSF